MHTYFKVIILVVAALIGNQGYTQKVLVSKKVSKINQYVNFTNESIHGLLIVHRMLENFNRNINKYVDLPDQKLNPYTNKDLPLDIFEDEDNLFYDTSPNEWFKLIMKDQQNLSSEEYSRLNAPTKEMKAIIASVNQIRFDLEKLLNSLDLTKRENQSIVYDKLEEGVSLYKGFYAKQLILENEIAAIFKNYNPKAVDPETSSLLSNLENLYNHSRAVLTTMYKREGEDIGIKIQDHKAALEKFESVNVAKIKNQKLTSKRGFNNSISSIIRLSRDAINDELAFEQSKTVPEEYKIYDRYYYWYNISTINKFNRYGSGIVFESNNIISTVADTLCLKFEMPHYFKVVYPQKLEKTDRLVASDPIITSLPSQIMDRSVVKTDRKIIVDNYDMDFKIYDHKIIDKDIVSISFNGDWILENFEISATPKNFKIALNKLGKNYLLLHAVDEGRNPPATIALSYKFNGKLQTIILNSDKNKSEMIEIEINK